MNIPDTVNDSRIRAIAERFGTLVKIVLRPDHEGAIVEFADINAAGKASLKLEGHEIVPGRRIRVGTARDVTRQKIEQKAGTTKAKPIPTPSVLQMSGPIKRPTQPGARGGGRRGGLGFKRSGATAPDRSHDQEMALDFSSGDAEKKPKKSNDDFRAMIQGSGK
jgi:hypothetical protein